MNGFHIEQQIDNVGMVQSINGAFLTVCSEYAFRSASHDAMNQLGFDHVGPQFEAYGHFITTYRIRPPLPPVSYQWRRGETLPNGGYVSAVTDAFVTLIYDYPPGAVLHQYMLDHGWQYCGPVVEKSNGSCLVTYQKCGAARA